MSLGNRGLTAILLTYPLMTFKNRTPVFYIPDSMFVVGPLSNGTEYHVRVRTLNAAGYSDWFEISETAKTVNDAVRMATTLILVVVAFVITRCY